MALILNEVAKSAGAALTRSGHSDYVRADQLENLFNHCEKLGVRLVGAEGFHLSDGTVVPEMDAILDLSGADAKVDPAAVRFAKRFEGSGLHFEVSLVDENAS